MYRGQLLRTAIVVASVLFDYVTPGTGFIGGVFDGAQPAAAQTQSQFPYLNGAPASPRALVQDLSSGTYQYVYLGNGSQNIIQNGDFLIDQQNAGASVTLTSSNTAGYRAPDRWINWFYVSGGSAGNPAAQQVSATTGAPVYVQDELEITANSSAGTSTPAGSYGFAEQSVEGSDVEDLAWGSTSGGTHVGVSVWLKASVAGTYAIALQNSAGNRSLVHDCVVGTAATWTNCNFTVNPPTTGTWNKTYGTVGMNFYVTHTCGSTFQSTAANRDVWQTGKFYCSVNQTQLTNNASATLEIAAVTVTKGRQPVAFVADPMAVSLTKLRRFYQTSFPIGTAPAQSGGLAGAVCVAAPVTTSGGTSAFVAFAPPMYSSPTLTAYDPAAGDTKWNDVTASGHNVSSTVDPGTAKGLTGFEIQTAGAANAAADNLCIHWSADTGL